MPYLQWYFSRKKPTYLLPSHSSPTSSLPYCVGNTSKKTTYTQVLELGFASGKMQSKTELEMVLVRDRCRYLFRFFKFGLKKTVLYLSEIFIISKVQGWKGLGKWVEV